MEPTRPEVSLRMPSERWHTVAEPAACEILLVEAIEVEGRAQGKTYVVRGFPLRH